jgi:tetratricopeptide (TPR) repeat protein
MRRAIPGLVCAALAFLAPGAPVSAQTSRLGTIDFPTSGAPAAQPQFVRGVLLLHSFEYRDAAQAFREAQRLDPGFALAYWGEALTYTHPIWNEQDVSAAHAALQRLGPTPAARRAKAPTPREQAYLETVEILYGDGPKARRDTAYSLAMERLVTSFPADREARVFYALSLLGLNQGVRDVPTYMRAAAIVERVFQDNPNHPGAAHLLIHCYDDPIRAPLGLPAARAYSKIAPDAAHAQHMTTHIFLALGMWDEVVSQNELASGRDRAAWTANHYTAWLGYGYLQQGRYGDALRHLNLMHRNMDWSRPRQRAELALMRADYVVNTERWDSPALQGGRIDLAEARLRDRAVDAFVFGLSAVKRGDRAGAERNLVDLATFSQMRAAIDTGAEKDRVPGILEKELRALLRLADGAVDDAVALLREDTALEDAMPLEFGPPAVVKPSHELLCEVLLQADRPREAQVECARALRLAPKRARSLLGLGRAAAAAGDRKTAARAYGDLRAIWHRADPDLPGLAEAVRFLGLPGRSEKGGS